MLTERTCGMRSVKRRRPFGNTSRTIADSVTFDRSGNDGRLAAPANGQEVVQGNAQYLKGQDFPHSITEDGKADCESGQRGWLERQAVLWPREQAGAPLKIARDPVTPGVQGPTYAGRAEVYPGQTFTRNPETGPFRLLNRDSEFGGR